MKYTIYSQVNGQILKNVETKNIELQIQENQAYIDGFFDDEKYYIENSLPVAIPIQPSKYAIFDYATKQWVVSEDLASQDVLSKRLQLLYSSDWTQIPNNPLTTEQQTAWATYRQELRDITLQSGYPLNVVWPIAPT